MTVRDSGALRDAKEENTKIQKMIADKLENVAISGTSGDELHRMAPTVTIGTELTSRNRSAKPAAFTIKIEDGGIAHHPDLVLDTVIEKLKEIPELAALIAADAGEHNGKKLKPYFASSEKDTIGIKIHFPMEKGKADELITALAKRAETLEAAAAAPNITPIPTEFKPTDAAKAAEPVAEGKVTAFPSDTTNEAAIAKAAIEQVLGRNSGAA